MSTPTPKLYYRDGELILDGRTIFALTVIEDIDDLGNMIVTAVNSHADLVAALTEIASDCADLQRVDIVSHAEARTWKTIENRARAAIANAKVQHAGETTTEKKGTLTQKEGD